MNDKHLVLVGPATEAVGPEERPDLFRMRDVPCIHQEDGVEAWLTRRDDVCVNGCLLGLKDLNPVEELDLLIHQVIPSPNDDRRLDEALPDGRCKRVAEDDVLRRGLRVRCSCQAHERVRVEIANRLGECGAEVRVMLVGKGDEIREIDEVLIEGLTETLLELVRPAAYFARRADKRLH